MKTIEEFSIKKCVLYDVSVDGIGHEETMEAHTEDNNNETHGSETGNKTILINMNILEESNKEKVGNELSLSGYEDL